MDSSADTAAAQPNGKGQLLVNKEGRKPLFAGSSSKEGTSKEDERRQPNSRLFRPGGAAGDASWWRTNSDTQAATSDRRDSADSVTSPAGTRLPRPKSGAASSHRRPFSLSEAYKLAEDEDDSDRAPGDGSPSPAPRSWHSRLGSDSTRKAADVQGRRLSEAADKNGGAVGKARTTTPRTLDTGRELAKVTGNEGNWRDRPKTSPTKPRDSAEVSRQQASGEDLLGVGSIPDLVPGIEDVPLPSIETGSPEKSFAWQVDQDFTAGDLQVSDSPRIKVNPRPFAGRLAFNDNSDIDLNSPTRVNHPGSQNTKLDEIRSREAKTSTEAPAPKLSPRSNTRIDEIRESEERAEREIPLSERRLVGRKNTKLDEIQQLEQNPLSQRALAQARLSDIRERNSMARSMLADDSRPTSSQDVARQSTPETRIPVRSKSAFEVSGERIPDTPITVYKNRRDTKDRPNKDDAQTKPKRNGLTSPPANTHKRDDSRDVLRRLSRATSNSPGPATEGRPLPRNGRDNTNRLDARARPGARKPNNGRRNGNSDMREPDALKRTVGFAGLRRVQSTESTKSKRSSLHSDNDPTDRYEAEMRLFAPQDNHSDRGSARAPSPEESESEAEKKDPVEATPKPKKQDPRTMPTPKVIGAYVDTPATVRVEKRESVEETKDEEKNKEQEKPLAKEKKRESFDMPEIIVDDRPPVSWRNRDQDTASDPGTGDAEKEDPIAASAPARRPRARSLPRRRPPLKNTAKPPSVKEDLKALQQAYNIEDSTLEDLDEVFSVRKITPPTEALMQHLPDSESSDSDEDFDLDYAPTNKAVKQESPNAGIGQSALEKAKEEYETATRRRTKADFGLLGVQESRRGIGRLVDQVSSVAPIKSSDEKLPLDTMATTEIKREHSHDHVHKHLECPECAAQPSPSTVAYIHIPVPRLFHQTPHFRLTLLGLVVTLLSLWGATESAMCAKYCRPEVCDAPPCVWSYDDPSFGTALPVKLDQWATGGYGRAVFNIAVEDAQDWLADVLDVAHGRAITDVDVSAMSFHEKRQHRRRLRKKGLVKTPRPESPEQQAKWDAWHQTRVAKERAREARDMGYDVRDEDDGTVGGDERVW